MPLTAIEIRTTSTNEPLVSINRKTTLVPASVQKCITAMAALESLGPHTKIATRVYTSSPVENGVIHGNIIIKGGGDPSLGCDYFGDRYCSSTIFSTWVSHMKKNGITRIKGNIIGDGTLLRDQPLSRYAIWEDLGNYYGGVTSGLSFNGNLYKLFLSSPPKPHSPVKILKTIPEHTSITSWDNRLRTGTKGSGDNAYIFGTPWSPIRLLSGTIPPGKGEFIIKGALPNPAYTCAALLREAFIAQGIKVQGDAIESTRGITLNGSTLLTEHYSPETAELIQRLNKKSDNVFAEQLFLLTAYKEEGIGTWDNGAKAIENILKRNAINVHGVFLKDGSGLSRYNGLTVKFLCDCLNMAFRKPWFPSFYESLPVSGIDGSLKGRLNSKILKGRIRAKTGTMERVQALAGYVQLPDNSLVTVSCIVNNQTLSYSATMKVFGQILTVVMKNGMNQ